jgi:hypothetical protein
MILDEVAARVTTLTDKTAARDLSLEKIGMHAQFLIADHRTDGDDAGQWTMTLGEEKLSPGELFGASEESHFGHQIGQSLDACLERLARQTGFDLPDQIVRLSAEQLLEGTGSERLLYSLEQADGKLAVALREEALGFLGEMVDSGRSPPTTSLHPRGDQTMAFEQIEMTAQTDTRQAQFPR